MVTDGDVLCEYLPDRLSLVVETEPVVFVAGNGVVALRDVGGEVTKGCPSPRGDVELNGLEEMGGGLPYS